MPAAPAATEAGFHYSSTLGVAALSATAFMLQAGRKRRAAGRVQKVLVNSRIGEAVETVPTLLATPATTEINYYKLDEIDAPKIVEYMK